MGIVGTEFLESSNPKSYPERVHDRDGAELATWQGGFALV